LKAIAQRYARALVDVAVQQNKAEEVKGELAGLAALVAGSADLRSFLANPAVGRDKKQVLMEKVCAGVKISRTLRNFVMVLVDNRRAGLLPQINEAYAAQLNTRLGVAVAEVTSARELTGDEKSKLNTALGRMTGKRVQAEYRQDAALIGGAIVRIGSTVYNGSVRDQLARLRAKLEAE
jgi:F-type H+-transporting ATPase subunit delta